MLKASNRAHGADRVVVATPPRPGPRWLLIPELPNRSVPTLSLALFISLTSVRIKR
jgi:hypothetical protein